MAISKKKSLTVSSRKRKAPWAPSRDLRSDDEESDNLSNEDVAAGNDEGRVHDQDDDKEDDESDASVENGEQRIVSRASHRHKVKPLVKKNVAGIIYISSVPKHMNVTILRELLDPYGEVGRIYMQPARKGNTVRKRTAKGKRAMLQYTEAWVEFAQRRVAKAVVQQLNAKPISTSRKSVFCDILWSMKYLPHFQWMQLSERLAYEKAVARQKLHTEVAQARKEASYFQSNLDRSEASRRRAAALCSSSSKGCVPGDT
ncbi:activator of basal transcription 1-like [Anopheles albimanus]|uniref:Activator of basal transcription 1 n=1 Tax=Anopheles albimanus TaxID=7167 RepID=A0A182F9Z2_ANOAL|nr:activator of basal transcription 1-like [Anopheles albimanus]